MCIAFFTRLTAQGGGWAVGAAAEPAVGAAAEPAADKLCACRKARLTLPHKIIYWRHNSASEGHCPPIGGGGRGKQAKRDCATWRNARTSSGLGRSNANRAQSQHEALPAKRVAMDSLTPTAPKSSATSCVGGGPGGAPPLLQKCKTCKLHVGWLWWSLCPPGIRLLLALCLAGSAPGWHCWLALCCMWVACVPGWLRQLLSLNLHAPIPMPFHVEPLSWPTPRTHARLPVLPRKRCP